MDTEDMKTKVITSICFNCTNSGTISVVEKKHFEAYKKNMFIIEDGVCKCIKCESDKVLIRDRYSLEIVDIEWI